jgi:hypothetical protein
MVRKKTREEEKNVDVLEQDENVQKHVLEKDALEKDK